MIVSRHYLPLNALLVVLTLLGSAVRGQQVEEKFVVIKAGRVITVSGDELLNADIVLVDGKIRLVGKDLDYPKSATVIDARRETVMPGMIHPRTRWQLPSYSRSGVHGNASAAAEVYWDDIDFQPLVEAGFTAVAFYPTGSGITGPAAVYRTAGNKGSRELGTGYLRITMMSGSRRDKAVLRGAIDKARKEIEKVQKARKAWEEKQKKAKEEAAKKAKAEAAKKPTEKPKEEAKDKPATAVDAEKKPAEKREGEKDSTGGDGERKPEVFVPPKIDPTVLPIVQWIRGDKEKPPILLFELSRASDLLHLDDVLKGAKELPGTSIYLAASYSTDYHHVVEQLAKRKAITMLAPQVGRLPNTVTRINLPGELALSGCSLAFLPAADTTTELRQFRQRVADLVRAGLAREDALKAITLHPAQILGLGDRLGTIEKDKDADLIFLNGDPLDPHTGVTRVMTMGDIVWEAPER